MHATSTAASGNEASVPHDPAHAWALAGETAAQRRQASAGPLATLATWWRTTLWLPIVVLAAVTAVTAVMCEVLGGNIEPLPHHIGPRLLFVGLILLLIVGNHVELYSSFVYA